MFPSRITIKREFISGTQINSVEVVRDTASVSGDTRTLTIYTGVQDNSPFENVVGSADAGQTTIIINVNAAVSRLGIDIVSDNSISPYATPVPGHIVSVTLRGTGVNPFGAENCV